MDILRTSLVVGLVLLLWNVGYHGVRPIRDFILWGIRYPFHFALMGLLILVIWGFLGADYGLQALFLVDNPWIQMLLGMTVMLLFAALILHYSVLDTPERWRDYSLRTLIRVLRDLNWAMPATYPVQQFLRNGFLERFSRGDIEAIDEVIRHSPEQPVAGSERSGLTRAELEELLGAEPFRLLFAPAILLVKSLALVGFAGLLPLLLPLLFGPAHGAWLERLPWLVGIALGQILAVVLACWTTRRVALAAEWEVFQRRVLEAVRAWASATKPAGAARSRDVDDASPLAVDSEREPARGRRPGWVAYLASFFLIHLLVVALLPESWTSLWIDWPEKTYIDRSEGNRGGPTAGSPWGSIPWLPMGVLAGEAVGAGVVLGGLLKLFRGPLRGWGPRSWGRLRRSLEASLRLLVANLSKRHVRGIFIGIVALLAVPAVVVPGLPDSVKASQLLGGLRAAVALGTFLTVWMICFRTATQVRVANVDRHGPGWIVPVATIVVLILFYLAPFSWSPLFAVFVAVVTVVVRLVTMIPPGFLWASAGRRARMAWVATMAAAVGSLVAGVATIIATCWALLAENTHWAATTATAMAAWIGLAVLLLSSEVLGEVGRRRPALLYPLTFLIGFVAFALPYNALDADRKSAMPAAGSIACMFALVAAVFTIVASQRPKSRLLASLVVVAAILLANGNAWFIAPNEFKTTFPNMEPYYARPVYLDSTDYVRATTPSSVRLRWRDDADGFDQPVPSERLATAYFHGLEQVPSEDGRHRVVSLRVDDPGGRLRAKEGDEVRLAYEDFYDILESDDDCIALVEESFYSKIFREFRYMALQMVRDEVTLENVFLLVPKMYELKLMSSVDGPKDIPTEGEKRIIVALDRVRNVLHIRIFDEGGHMVVDTDDQKWPMSDKRAQLDELKQRLGVLWSQSPISESDRARVITAVTSIVGHPLRAYTFNDRPGERLGIRLLRMHQDFERAGIPLMNVNQFDRAKAQTKHSRNYALISMGWKGRVYEVRKVGHRDSSRADVEYVVKFTLPEGTELAPGELEAMRSWLERCHLDTLRPAATVSPDGVVGPRRGDATDREGQHDVPGECNVLEDNRGEAPVPVACFLASAGEANTYPDEFGPYLPTPTRIKEVIREETPAPALRSDKQPVPVDQRSFILRPTLDRGIFAYKNRTGDPKTVSDTVVALFNAGRIQPYDRLILFWKGPGDVRFGRIFEVKEIAEEPPLWTSKRPTGTDKSFPQGSRQVTLKPIDGLSPDRSPRLPEDDGLVVGDWQVLGPLDNTEVLMAWKRLVGGLWIERKPKLVVVTVSGGGIRASVWTALVLQKLEMALGPDFPYHVRLITGASGGMVGASYYATSLTPPSDAILKGGKADFAALHGGVKTNDFVDQMARDQLDAVAGRLVFADLISPLNPFHQHGDRGKTLEQTWVRWTGGEGVSPLDRSLQSFAVDERLGWRPSLVYTPMMVEDGRRLLVSNIDLAMATRNVGGLLLEPSSRKIERPAFQVEDLDRSLHLEDEVFSVSAVEFSRLFPEAHEFPVTTAMRMSSSFPWVSPAVSLPTLPPRRVVDAGYYDNYGVNLTALWLAKMRPWLEANTSGVLVVQIRDRISQGARTEIDFDRPTGQSGLASLMTWHAGRKLLAPGLQGITTPLLGISNARNWTMSFRNDEQVDLLDLLFDKESRTEGNFFRTVVFECPVEVSLSWQLSAWEKKFLTGGFGKVEPSDPREWDPRRVLGEFEDYLTGPAAYSFKKSKNRLSKHALKVKYYDKELQKLGFQEQDLKRLTEHESEMLYENIARNLKRLVLLRDWWRERREDHR